MLLGHSVPQAGKQLLLGCRDNPATPYPSQRGHNLQWTDAIKTSEESAVWRLDDSMVHLMGLLQLPQLKEKPEMRYTVLGH